MFDLDDLKTPCYVIDKKLLINNLEIIKKVIDKTDCKILLAQKAFSMFCVYDTLKQYLHGTTASSLYEAILGYEKMQLENHIYSPAYKDDEFETIASICDHIVFNSCQQLYKFKDKAKSSSLGLRINPQYAEVKTDLYNPCAKFSRLGTTLDNFDENCLKFIDGLHFHTMCEQNSDVLERTLNIIEEKFGKYLHRLKWLNFGGGHHITRQDYDIDKLIKCINYFKQKYNLNIYLEPGEAIALNCGYVVSSVLDIMKNEMDIAIVDVSAACHMPDVLEMPYRPNIINSDFLDVYKYNYKIASLTCLAGDIIGDYSFQKELKVGGKLILKDMAHYTMVKNNTFNGISLPSIYILNEDSSISLIKHFGYNDFKTRLS